MFALFIIYCYLSQNVERLRRSTKNEMDALRASTLRDARGRSHFLPDKSWLLKEEVGFAHLARGGLRRAARRAQRDYKQCLLSKNFEVLLKQVLYSKDATLGASSLRLPFK